MENRVEIHSIGPFVLGKTLGTGTTGKVKLAFHKETGAKVAVKIINKEFLSTRQTVLRKVEREIAAMKVLNHSSVLRLYDVYESDKHLFLVLEHVEGGELFDYLIKKGRLDASEALIHFQQIIFGLDYCHSYLICHRDLKPENLLLDENKNIKIADFGMASLMRKGSLLSTSCGSPHYASPEVVQGVKYEGTSADIWSCGVILYALLTGKLPFDDDNIRRLLSKVKSGIFSMPPFLHKDIKDLIWKMLVVDPSKRITMQEIKQSVWFNSNRAVIPPTLGILDVKLEPIEGRLDDEVVRSLHSLGWGSETEVRMSLMDDSGKSDIQKAFYKLLLERSQVQQETLRMSAGITRTQSAPIAPLEYRPGSPAPMSPMATSPSINANRPLSNIAQIPVISNLSLIADTMTPPASPMIHQKSQVSHVTSNAGELHVSPHPDRLKKRSNSNSSSALNISAASNRLQRMKIESNSTPPGSPIIGTSHPKRSWFSNFFSNNDKSTAEKNSNKSSADKSYSMSSSKSADIIMSNLSRIFRKYHIIWDSEDSHTYTARHRSLSSPTSLKFRISVRSGGEGCPNLIVMEFISGEATDFENIWQLMEPEMINTM